MKKKYTINKTLQACFLLLLIITGTNISAQVGIGTTSPNAALDIASPNDGLLIPRVSLLAINSLSTSSSGSFITPIASELVYNTNTTLGPNGVTPGYYYLSNATGPWVWIRLSTGADIRQDWSLAGNTGTDPANNFLGTIDNQPLVLKTNSTERMRVLGTDSNGIISGNVGIGIANPQYKLDVNAASNPVRLQGLAAGAPGDDLISVGADGVLKKITSSASSTTISPQPPYVLPDNTFPSGSDLITFNRLSIPPVVVPRTQLTFTMAKTKAVTITYNVSMDDYTYTSVPSASPYVRYEVYKNNVATNVQATVQIANAGGNLHAASFTLTFTEILAPGTYTYNVRVRRINNVGLPNDNTNQLQGPLSVYATATYIN